MNESVSPLIVDTNNLTIEPSSNQNQSKVTEFPAAILGSDVPLNATKPQPITPQSANSNTQASSSTLTSTASTANPH